MRQKDPEISNWLFQKIAECHPYNLKRVGNLATMSCPFCDEYHTSRKHGHNAARGHYYIDRQDFWCFNCNKWASGLDLYAKLSGEDVSRGEFAKRFFFKRFSKDGLGDTTVAGSDVSGFNVNYRHPRRLQVPDVLKHPLTDQGKAYLDKRRIFEAPNLDHEIPFYSCAKKVSDVVYNAITIPWRFDGEDYFYQLRFIDNVTLPFGKYYFPSKQKTGLDKPVYGLDMIDVGFPYVICFEGVFDSIWVKNGVAIGGKTLSDYQRNIITTRYPRHKIVFAFDNDEAGKDAYRSATVKYPFDLYLDWFKKSNGCKDINDLVLSTGNVLVMDDADELESMISSAMALRISL